MGLDYMVGLVVGVFLFVYLVWYLFATKSSSGD